MQEKITKKKRSKAGYTLLEYSAGAAILMGILYTGLNAMGTGVKNLLNGVGTWATQQQSNLSGSTTQQ